MLIVMVKDADAEAAVESVTWTVKVEDPSAVGVPEIATELVLLEPRDNPAGSEPDVIDHVNGGTPPDSFTVALYAPLMLPEGSVVVVIDGGGSTVIEREEDIVG